jgi:hypothetical protein
MRPLLSVLLLASFASPLFGWGANGHRTIALIAQRYINDEAAAEIANLLDGRSLASVSDWADIIRSEERWDCASPFHYATIPPGASYLDSGVPPEGDVLGAIVYYEGLLSNRAAPTEQRAIALKFLVHFVGDVHQPLHVGLGCDRGGNDVEVEWMGETANLHSVWDNKIYDSWRLSYSEFADFIDTVDTTEIEKIQRATPVDWLNESQDFHHEVYRCSVSRDRCPCLCGDCDNGYSIFGGCTSRPCMLSVSGPIRLSWAYRYRARPIVERQLLKAGLRLAAVLNWALSNVQSSEPFETMKQKVKAKRDWDISMRGCPQVFDSPGQD